MFLCDFFKKAEINYFHGPLSCFFSSLFSNLGKHFKTVGIFSLEKFLHLHLLHLFLLVNRPFVKNFQNEKCPHFPHLGVVYGAWGDPSCWRVGGWGCGVGVLFWNVVNWRGRRRVLKVPLEKGNLDVKLAGVPALVLKCSGCLYRSVDRALVSECYSRDPSTIYGSLNMYR
ncbi:Hypothetical protein Cp262_2119 [Corynebacterium pseudotuberculosis]|nr:Hypothetical protein Cp262_2119 [Corynebacterium pseudotuberculosis]